MFKYKICVFLFLILGIFGFNFVSAEENNLPLLGHIIYIDPGHGGLDPGAIYMNIKEAPINLEISEKLEEALTKKGAIVYMTRYGDYDLSLPNASNHKRSDLNQRIKLINESNCSLFLSIHLNADISESWYGAQVFYDDINSENAILAEFLQNEFSKSLKSKRKIKEISDLYLYRKVEKPGVLVEVGFLSNANERYLLRQDSYQEKLVDTIVTGVINYLDSK
ncbi:MAG: N-acetylmuramoyl-L-alanine amidase CwlD [Bacilli bacterium]|nr:N-acetylmuramoyl-L-alanine amidase CwlD [Bacilli bacterium]MCI9434823.1 N-acetylmuramoyl-L-alanine amidase CwlD [Bacilli bacterium]